MSAYLTIREFNQITNFGEKVKTAKDFEFISVQRWHRKVDELNLMFRLSHKNREIKSFWMAKNTQRIYKYHRTMRANHG